MRSGLHHTLFMVLVAILLAIVCVPEVAPFSDFPNHVARVHVLSRLADPAYREVYESAWGAYPNLAFDGFGVGLSGLLSAPLAGRLFLALVVTNWCYACMRLGRAVTGRPSVRALVACTFVMNEHFLQGYVNFACGMGFAIHAIASIADERRRPIDLAWLAVCSVITAASHAAAIVTLIVGALAFVPRSAKPGRPFKERIGPIAAAVIPGGAYLAHWALALASGDQDKSFSPPTHSLKHLLFSTLPSFHGLVDKAVLGVVVLIALVALARHVRSGVSWPMLLGGAGLAALVFVAPQDVAGAYDSNGRYALGAFTLGLFALKPADFARTKLDAAMQIALLAVMVVRLGVLGKNVFELGEELAKERRVIAQLPEGAVLGNLTYFSEGDRATGLRERALLHAPAFATIDRKADVPTLYAIPGVQPLRHKHPKFDAHRFKVGAPLPDVERIVAELDAAWLCRAPEELHEALMKRGAKSLGKQGDCELVLWRTERASASKAN